MTTSTDTTALWRPGADVGDRRKTELFKHRHDRLAGFEQVEDTDLWLDILLGTEARVL